MTWKVNVMCFGNTGYDEYSIKTVRAKKYAKWSFPLERLSPVCDLNNRYHCFILINQRAPSYCAEVCCSFWHIYPFGNMSAKAVILLTVNKNCIARGVGPLNRSFPLKLSPLYTSLPVLIPKNWERFCPFGYKLQESEINFRGDNVRWRR